MFSSVWYAIFLKIFLVKFKTCILCKPTNVINIKKLKKKKNEFGFHTKILTIDTIKIN